MKFTAQGEVQLTLSYDDSTNTMVFDVRDTGIGMSEDHAKRVFRSFEQGDATMTRKFGGTGLGLVLSRNLARQLGGDVVLASTEEGKGSHFRATIAAPETECKIGEQSREPSLPANLETHEKREEVRLDGVRVLLIEDGPDNQLLISRILRKVGAQVDVQGNGKLGVEAFCAADGQQSAHDIILKDMQMPVMNGYDATRQLRREGHKVPIIAVTAHALIEEEVKCIDAGCDLVEKKPIRRQSLLAAIRKLVR